MAWYRIERLLGARQLPGSSKRQFLVRWLGYGAEEDSWEDESSILNEGPTSSSAPLDDWVEAE